MDVVVTTTSRFSALFDAGARHDTTRHGAEVILATVSTRQARRFALATSATAVAILVQAVVAGLIVNRDGKDGWVTKHGVVADVSWVMALGTTLLAWVTMRAHRRSPVSWSVILFLATPPETGLGQLVATDNSPGRSLCTSRWRSRSSP